MYLKYVQIVNFKNLKNVRFEFSKGANTIIGENDSGKSNALTAIRILLDDNYYYNTKRLKETDFSYECFLLGKHTVERVCSGLSPLRRDRLWC